MCNGYINNKQKTMGAGTGNYGYVTMASTYRLDDQEY